MMELSNGVVTTIDEEDLGREIGQNNDFVIGRVLNYILEEKRIDDPRSYLCIATQISDAAVEEIEKILADHKRHKAARDAGKSIIENCTVLNTGGHVGQGVVAGKK